MINLGKLNNDIFYAMGKIMDICGHIHQDQTAQNVQSDLVICHLLVYLNLCAKILCGTRWIVCTVVNRGRFYISCAERVKYHFGQILNYNYRYK